MTGRFLLLIVVCGVLAALPWVMRDEFKDRAVETASEWAEQGANLAKGLAPETETTALAASRSTKPAPSSGRSTEAIQRVKPALETALKEKGLAWGNPVFLRVFKESSELELWMRAANAETFTHFRTYEICRWSGTLGPKLKQGDGQAPEGFYFVSAGRMNPNSNYHLSFDLGYPNAYDLAHRRTGSLLMVHGGCVSIGCYAMTDARIEEIYALTDAALRAGQPFFRVHCFPFRMTDERMDEAEAKKEKWLEFWTDLKTGYDYFEVMGLPPNIEVKEGRYEIVDSTPVPAWEE